MRRIYLSLFFFDLFNGRYYSCISSLSDVPRPPFIEHCPINFSAMHELTDVTVDLFHTYN